MPASWASSDTSIPPCDAADEPIESRDGFTAINVRGVRTCMKHQLRQMRAQGGGAIVNCSSLGFVGLPGRASYHATKHGVIGLTKNAALEYAPPSTPSPAIRRHHLALGLTARRSGSPLTTQRSPRGCTTTLRHATSQRSRR